jgi:hypothetical protein
MRMNLPVDQQDFDYPSDQMLVSTNDTKSNIGLFQAKTWSLQCMMKETVKKCNSTI